MIIKLVQTTSCSADWITPESMYRLKGKRGGVITIFSSIPTIDSATELLVVALCTDPTSLTLAYDTTVPDYWLKYLTIHHYDYLVTNHPEILL
jgi:hypothetical protein